MTALAMNATAPPFAAATPSLALTPASFRDALGSSPASLVLFGAGWCAPCRAFQDKIELMQGSFVGLVPGLKLGTVDLDRYPQFRAWEQIRELPTAKLYVRGVGEPHEYPGDWSAAALLRWTRRELGLRDVSVSSRAAPPPAPALTAERTAAYLRAVQSALEGGAARKAERKRAAQQPLLPEAQLARRDLSATLGPVLGHVPRAQQQALWKHIRQALDARPRADELKELSRQLAIEATRAETLARRAGPAAEDSVWPGRQSIETFGDEAVPVGVDDIAEV